MTIRQDVLQRMRAAANSPYTPKTPEPAVPETPDRLDRVMLSKWLRGLSKEDFFVLSNRVWQASGGKVSLSRLPEMLYEP